MAKADMTVKIDLKCHFLGPPKHDTDVLVVAIPGGSVLASGSITDTLAALADEASQAYPDWRGRVIFLPEGVELSWQEAQDMLGAGKS